MFNFKRRFRPDAEFNLWDGLLQCCAQEDSIIQRNFYMVRLIWDWEVIEFLFAKNPEDSTLWGTGLPQVQWPQLLLQTWPQGQEFAENVPPPALSIDLEEPANRGVGAKTTLGPGDKSYKTMAHQCSFMERAAAAALVERETIFHCLVCSKLSCLWYDIFKEWIFQATYCTYRGYSDSHM